MMILLVFTIISCWCLEYTGANVNVKYTPISGFDQNRLAFYNFERKLVQSSSEIDKIAPHSEDVFRITYFDSHWHGITIEEYLRIAYSTQSDILICRGVPEKEGYKDIVLKRIIDAGFHESSLIASPQASLPSGLLIGVRNGASIVSVNLINSEDGTAAFDLRISLKKRSGGDCFNFHVLVLTFDPFDEERRRHQFSKVNGRISQYLKENIDIVLVGGFYSPKWPRTSLNNVFPYLEKPRPLYTSWTGECTDGIFTSPNMSRCLKNATIFHTDIADSLPIVTDFSRELLLFNGNDSAKSAREWVLIVGIASLIFTSSVVVFVLLMWRKSRKDTLALQTLALSTFTDNDLKMRRASISPTELLVQDQVSVVD